MSVNFHREDDSDVMVCDECGYEVDDDHYNDMVAHDDEHAAEAERVRSLPRTVIHFVRSQGEYRVLEKSVDGVYVEAVTTSSYETARKIERALS